MGNPSARPVSVFCSTSKRSLPCRYVLLSLSGFPAYIPYEGQYWDVDTMSCCYIGPIWPLYASYVFSPVPSAVLAIILPHQQGVSYRRPSSRTQYTTMPSAPNMRKPLHHTVLSQYVVVILCLAILDNHRHRTGQFLPSQYILSSCLARHGLSCPPLLYYARHARTLLDETRYI